MIAIDKERTPVPRLVKLLSAGIAGACALAAMSAGNAGVAVAAPQAELTRQGILTPTTPMTTTKTCAPRTSDKVTSVHCSIVTRVRKSTTQARLTASQLKAAQDTNSVHVAVLMQGRRVKPLDVAVQCGQGYYNPDRFTACSAEGWEVQDTVTTNGVTRVDGDIQFNIDSSASFGTDGTGTWQLSSRVTTVSTSGTYQNGIGGQISTACGAAPTICETVSGNDFFPISIAPKGRVTNQWGQQNNGNSAKQANTVDFLNGHLGVVLNLNGTHNPVVINDAAQNTLYGRCDSVAGSTPDCVEQYGPMAVLFDGRANPNVAPVAQHVYDSQVGPTALPSHWGDPNYSNSALTRDQNPNDINANRGVACPTNKYPGQSCDEYSFAGSHQGAAFVAANDWSSAPVPKSANDSQGALLTNFNTFYRVLDPKLYLNNDNQQDLFYVQACLANGSCAW